MTKICFATYFTLISLKNQLSHFIGNCYYPCLVSILLSSSAIHIQIQIKQVSLVIQFVLRAWVMFCSQTAENHTKLLCVYIYIYKYMGQNPSATLYGFLQPGCRTLLKLAEQFEWLNLPVSFESIYAWPCSTIECKTGNVNNNFQWNGLIYFFNDIRVK